MKKVVKKISLSEIIKDRKRQILRNKVYREMKLNYKSGYPQIVGLSFDAMLSSINIEGLYEKEYLEIAIQWLTENDLIQGNAIDAGANIGNHSVFFAKYYDEVFSFEPNPLTFKVLKLNSEINSGKITCFQYGVSESSGQVKFHTPRQTHISSSRIVKDEKGDLKDSITIDLISLDELDELKNIKVGLLKIDTEGHEYQVLKGAKNLIETNRPVILFEQKIDDFKDGTSSSIEFLRNCNYTFFTLKYNPERGSHLGIIKRVFNISSSLLFGRTLTVVPEKYFPTAHYNFIIGIHQP